MTFEEYEEKHLHDLNHEARRLVRMGWNARASHGNCQGILDSSACEVPEGLDATREEWARINGRDHFRDATKMVQGDAVEMGMLTDSKGEICAPAMLIQFASVEDFHAARAAGQCRFTVFGGEV